MTLGNLEFIKKVCKTNKNQCYPWLMSPDKTVSLDFTYVTSIMASTEKLTSYLQL